MIVAGGAEQESGVGIHPITEPSDGKSEDANVVNPLACRRAFTSTLPSHERARARHFSGERTVDPRER